MKAAGKQPSKKVSDLGWKGEFPSHELSPNLYAEFDGDLLLAGLQYANVLCDDSVSSQRTAEQN